MSPRSGAYDPCSGPLCTLSEPLLAVPHSRGEYEVFTSGETRLVAPLRSHRGELT